MQARVTRDTNVEMEDPGVDESKPSPSTACGENPVVECDERANAPPQNFVAEVGVIPTTAETFIANVVHLREIQEDGEALNESAHSLTYWVGVHGLDLAPPP
jgi:hypothetical protein